MNFTCAHISDVHWRGLKRHEEYKAVFEKLFKRLREESPDLIFIGGDIVHSKTQGISPELIDNLNWWFKSLADIAPTHIILGNHDGLILNKDRQDAISPIISALNNPNIKLYKESGVYPAFTTADNKVINWCVFSCFDEENWINVKPVKGDINIACFHGAVWGSKTDIDWELEGEVNLSFFEDYDFSFLGDIHKKQYLDDEKRVAYPGSTIQQNYGEDIKKGFLLWNIKNANEYDSKFISIENPSPFITIDWKGSVEKTIPYLAKVKSKSRFRIRSNNNISQVEIKLLHHYLKEEKKAKEIVYQNTGKDSFEVKNISKEKAEIFDVRSKSSRKNLISDLLGETIQDELKETVSSLFDKYLDQIPQNLASFVNKDWCINNIKFNNTFSYGKENYINFDKLNGVVGVFGNNRAGKSSIPGTLMYCLFNSTDRGSIKNQSIVNTRKGFCDAEIELSYNCEKYSVKRKTVKKSKNNGEISSSTSLSLKNLNNNSDKTEEQRRETEKILKSMIGTPEDFLYTSFASQGEINAFIKEKSSARKSVLAKFLNLDLYEELYKKSREDYIVLKNKYKNIKEENWDQIIENYNSDINENKNEENKAKNFLSQLREKEVKLNVEIASLKKDETKHPSGYTLKSAESELKYLSSKIEENKSNVDKYRLLIDQDSTLLKKINIFKSSFSIDDIEKEKKKLDSLRKKLDNFKRSKVIAEAETDRNKDRLKILEEVPCNEEYSSCKFIKDAYQSKENISSLEEEIRSIGLNVLEISSAVKSIEKQDLEEKIKKFNSVLNKEYKANVDTERNQEKLELSLNNIEALKSKTRELEKIHQELLANNNDDLIIKMKKVKQELNNTTSKILSLESSIIEINKCIYEIESNIVRCKNKKEEYYSLIDEWKSYDLFSFAVSKKGIPTMLINNSLPLINSEINKILSTVTTFSINLEDDGTNLNVYIDYGDSKRIIECASGMEKMMASIAIRVALISISSLPKSNIFIIDEGFGALDSSNIEACSRLLKSLKKYFKTIMIISHVDSIKDIVDKNIEINRKGNDSHVEYRWNWMDRCW